MIIKKITDKIEEIRLKKRYQLYIWLDQICSFIPGESGWLIRRFIYKKRIISGDNVAIDEHVCIKYPERLSIGNNSYIGRNSMIQASGFLEIGNDVIIGPYVKIWSSDHIFDRLDIAIHLQGHSFAKVIIGNDVWIGTNTVILKGISIGDGAVVAAGSLVNKDVPKYAVVAGNPAKVIKYRDDKGN